MAAIIPLFVAVPLGGAFLIALIGVEGRRVPDVIGVAVAMSLLVLSAAAVWLVQVEGTQVYRVGGWMPPFGIALVLDALSAFLLLTIGLVTATTTVFSVRYLDRYSGKGYFFALFLLMLAGINGVVVTGDLFNLYVFLEVASVSSYALVAFGTERREIEAAFKYAVMGSLGSLFVLIGIAFLYLLTSSLNMADIGSTLRLAEAPRATLLVTLLFVAGFGLKAAVAPFHSWLPDAHPAAPAPVSAMLSGVLIKVLGVYALARVLLNVIGLSEGTGSILMALGVLSMVLGVFLACVQWDIKRLWAYSSISHVGYILLGIGLGTPLGILGALLHVFNHAVFKSLLFLVTGALEQATGTRDLHRMGGLARRMPITSAAALAGTLSLAGVPPLGGFWSKLILIIAAIQGGQYGWAFAAAATSVGALGYGIKALRYSFHGELNQEFESVNETPGLMLLPIVTLAVISALGGLFLLPGLQPDLLHDAAKVLADGVQYCRIDVREGI